MYSLSEEKIKEIFEHCALKQFFCEYGSWPRYYGNFGLRCTFKDYDPETGTMLIEVVNREGVEIKKCYYKGRLEARRYKRDAEEK